MPVRPEVMYQRQRQSPDRLNNSARRTYDLLRSTLVTTGDNTSLVEQELTEAMSASRNTIRAVLQRLAREGLVTREPKNGTHATASLVLRIDELSSFDQYTTEAPIEVRALECRPLGCPPMVRDRLRLPEGWTVLMIESLVLEDGRPLGLTVNYIALAEDQSPDFDIEAPDVLLILERQLGINVGASSTTVGAVAADEQSAELLGVEVGAPMVWLEDVIEDDCGQPRALSQFRLRGDRVSFSVTAHRRTA
ncbi:MAG: GntR family transcriptional regulator [Mycobacterium sp.]|jgi:GntR family transcriptional regulator|nr:GntR family transcriptional regulator [Mycobacterium sp.]